MTTDTDAPNFLFLENGRRIAYHKTGGKTPTVIFFGGFMSDMEGSKALALEEYCKAQGQAYIRFDYSGHGSSSGEFRDGTIGDWKEDALAVVQKLTDGPVLIIGSSMGGWIGLLVALEVKDRLSAFIGIAPAPDFTRDLMWDSYSPEIQEKLRRDGVYYEPSEYSDEPYAISYRLIEEGDNHLLLGGPIELDCPVRLIHGQRDEDVPARWSQRISDALVSVDVEITYIKNGDHRLSSDKDLKRLCLTLDTLLET
ncbi:alpha/beta hydrolase [Emcibacter sp.]|uniref:alpha/beta hydrolase n=1 Tax=Emcibacter sp. TaxID=1979954 RepID=UPI002AA6BE0B|nr:alpha/beta hydrolase [Emcibacter sp.]